VLHLFSFTEDAMATAVRVTDGLGNEAYIPVVGSTENNEDTIITAELIEEKNGEDVIYKVVAQDYKAGLWKIVRGEEVEAGEITSAGELLAGFGNKDGIMIGDAENPVQGSKVEETGLYEYTNNEGVTITIDGGIYEEYTLNRVTRTVDQEGAPIITIYDALGNKRTVSFDDIAFACLYATYNEENALSVNIKETRGIWKVTAEIAENANAEGTEYVLEVFHRDHEPIKLIKTYQVPAGVVKKVTVYNTNSDTDLKNDITTTAKKNVAQLQSVAEIRNAYAGASDKNAVLDKLINVKQSDLALDEENKITGATVRAKHGIKKISYEAAEGNPVDDTVVEFYKDLPTELFVNCMIDNRFTKAVVVDATGCALTINQDKVTLDYTELITGLEEAIKVAPATAPATAPVEP